VLGPARSTWPSRTLWLCMRRCAALGVSISRVTLGIVCECAAKICTLMPLAACSQEGAVAAMSAPARSMIATLAFHASEARRRLAAVRQAGTNSRAATEEVRQAAMDGNP
jgi:hypothetical protein